MVERSMKMRALLAIALFTFVLLCIPKNVSAGTVAVFFSGLCRQDVACQANEQANASIRPKLEMTPGTRMIIALRPEWQGKFPSPAHTQQVIAQTGNDQIVFIAYSGGNQAMYQMALEMHKQNPTSLKRVKAIIALDSHMYSGYTGTVTLVEKQNPGVVKQPLTKEMFNTTHGVLSGNAGVADAIAKTAGVDPTVVGQVPPPNQVVPPPNQVVPPPQQPPYRLQTTNQQQFPYSFTTPYTSAPISWQTPLFSSFAPVQPPVAIAPPPAITTAQTPVTQTKTTQSTGSVIPKDSPIFSTSSLVSFSPITLFNPYSITGSNEPTPIEVIKTASVENTYYAPPSVSDQQKKLTDLLSNIKNALQTLMRSI